MSSDKQKHWKTVGFYSVLEVSQPENSLKTYQKLKLILKCFQELLLDTILGGFWAQVGDQKSPKKGSKTQKNHIQDNIITNNIFNKNMAR